MLGVAVDALTLADAVAVVHDAVAHRRKAYVVFCTVSSILWARDDPTVARAMAAAELVTPDGMPLVWLGRRAGMTVERVYGPDLMRAVFATDEGGLRHFFYGSSDDVLVDLVANLTASYPAISVAGWKAAPPELDPLRPPPEDLAAINSAGADIVWVGLGHPKQDLFAWANQRLLQAPVVAGVGAAFDYLSGHAAEAPVWMKRCGLQWLHRLAHDPRRLWRRYIVGNARFVALLSVHSFRRRYLRSPGVS